MHRACHAQAPLRRVASHVTMDLLFNLTAAVMFVGLDSFTMAQISLVLHVWRSFSINCSYKTRFPPGTSGCLDCASSYGTSCSLCDVNMLLTQSGQCLSASKCASGFFVQAAATRSTAPTCQLC
jgi:hypothetical protein